MKKLILGFFISMLMLTPFNAEALSTQVYNNFDIKYVVDWDESTWTNINVHVSQEDSYATIHYVACTLLQVFPNADISIYYYDSYFEKYDEYYRFSNKDEFKVLFYNDIQND